MPIILYMYYILISGMCGIGSLTHMHRQSLSAVSMSMCCTVHSTFCMYDITCILVPVYMYVYVCMYRWQFNVYIHIVMVIIL